MTGYDLDFLTSNWDASGFDLELVAVGNSESMDTAAVPGILATIQARCRVVSVRGTGNEDSPLVVSLERVDERPFAGHVTVSIPDEVAIGGPAETFFTGNESSDLQLARSLAMVLLDATSKFAMTHFSFGASHSTAGRARRLRRDAYLASNHVRPSADELAGSICDFCRRLRP